MRLIAGVDEVGRGSLAGPVMAAAVILNPNFDNTSFVDSKLLTPKKRETLCKIIQKTCISWAIGQAEIEEIDQINILQASLLAMKRAIDNLKIKPHHIKIDGAFCPQADYSIEAIIGGDRLVPAISAASIVAKVIRDQEMCKYALCYPNYSFEKHKGYGTRQHILAIKKFGITSIHRKSFSPIKELCHAIIPRI
jgi:ribonuclease HII